MYGMNYSGGDNRTHGQIERAERIDSFEVARVDGWGTLFTSGTIPLECSRFVEYGPGLETDREIVELFRGQWSTTLELTRAPSGFGGHCTFWVCPSCGKRVRYLYFKDKGFACRICCKLNYCSQQRTHDSTNFARDGLKLARDKLGWEPPFSVAPVEFPYVTPDRPKGMHRRTYYRYLARYRRYQEKYQWDSMREMMAILRR